MESLRGGSSEVERILRTCPVTGKVCKAQPPCDSEERQICESAVRKVER